MTIPKGRAWVIKASGGKVPSQFDNRASIQLTLHVPDARCNDAGLYTCNAGFRPTNGVYVASCSQNRTFKGPCNRGMCLGSVDCTQFVRNMFLVLPVMLLWPRLL
ncbi:unnamed protein product [Lymnaea stagnalis]|uniref:Ig-like domain-containing protein n=1 Tax=Lymnaea stagnalis TaxID=6523 RepID=A0AAV2IMD3_LYMST